MHASKHRNGFSNLTKIEICEQQNSTDTTASIESRGQRENFPAPSATKISICGYRVLEKSVFVVNYSLAPTRMWTNVSFFRKQNYPKFKTNLINYSCIFKVLRSQKYIFFNLRKYNQNAPVSSCNPHKNNLLEFKSKFKSKTYF